jgi:hypothetical protein
VAKARKLKVARVQPAFFDKVEEEQDLVDLAPYYIKTEDDEEEEEEEEEAKPVGVCTSSSLTTYRSTILYLFVNVIMIYLSN